MVKLFSVVRHFSCPNGVNTREKRIGVGLVLLGPDSKAHYHLLQQDRVAIESAIGTSLEWRENVGKIESHLYIYAREMDPTIRELWPQQHEWMSEKLEILKRVFAPRIKLLNASEYRPEALISEEQ